MVIFGKKSQKSGTNPSFIFKSGTAETLENKGFAGFLSQNPTFFLY
jgi:hypothetical protein